MITYEHAISCAACRVIDGTLTLCSDGSRLYRDEFGRTETMIASDEFKGWDDEALVEDAHADGNHSWCAAARGCRTILVHVACGKRHRASESCA